MYCHSCSQYLRAGGQTLPLSDLAPVLKSLHTGHIRFPLDFQGCSVGCCSLLQCAVLRCGVWQCLESATSYDSICSVLQSVAV